MTAPLSAAEFNARFPVGTRVVAYPMVRPEHPVARAYQERLKTGRLYRTDRDPCRRLETVTRTPAWTVGGDTPVVSVEGYAGGIALTHVDVAEPPLAVLLLAEARTDSPSDRLAYVLDRQLVDHPECCSTDADYPGWTPAMGCCPTHTTPAVTA